MRGRILIAAAAAPLTLPAAGLAGGGPAFGNGKYPLESRTFAGCKRFEATRASCTRGARAYEGALETFS